MDQKFEPKFRPEISTKSSNQKFDPKFRPKFRTKNFDHKFRPKIWPIIKIGVHTLALELQSLERQKIRFSQKKLCCRKWLITFLCIAYNSFPGEAMRFFLVYFWTKTALFDLLVDLIYKLSWHRKARKKIFHIIGS